MTCPERIQRNGLIQSGSQLCQFISLLIFGLCTAEQDVSSVNFKGDWQIHILDRAKLGSLYQASSSG